MRKRRFAIALGLILAVSVLIVTVSPKRTKPVTFGNSTESYRQTMWGASSEVDPSIGDKALVSIKLDWLNNARIEYMDTETGKKRVFCTRPNCLHSDEKCISFFPGSTVGNQTDGAMLIGEKIYCVTLANANNSSDLSGAEWQILELDANTNTRRIVKAFRDIQAAELGDRNEYVKSIRKITYNDGFLFCILDYQRAQYYEKEFISHPVPYCINLETGEEYTLSEDGYYLTGFMTYDPEHILYYCVKAEGMLDLYEMNEMIDRDDSAEIDFTLMYDYQNYFNWYTQSNKGEGKIILANLLTGEKTILYDEETVYFSSGANFLKYEGVGICDNYLIMIEYGETEKGVYSDYSNIIKRINLDTLEEDILYSSDNMNLVSVAQGHCVDYVLADGMLYFADNITDETLDIYGCNVVTGEVKYLYTDKANVTFRLYGCMGDGYCGKLSYRQDYDEFYYISVEDYQSGNFEAAVRYKW